MSKILYLQMDNSIEVTHPHVYLQDIAQLACSDPKLLNRLRVLPIVDFTHIPKKQYVLSVLDLTQIILAKEPELEINALGEEDFVITYQSRKTTLILQWIKVIFVCFCAFFGSAFSIMTFNRDADVGSLFQQIYAQITGNASNGFTILEISYSIGIGLGVLFFFNHFGRFHLSGDPTPMQIKMEQYEEDVNTTIIKDARRKS